MRTHTFALVLVLATALSPASALAQVETESRSIPAFHAVHVRGGAELTIRRGDGPSLAITGERDEVPEWRTEVKEGVLHIEPTSARRGSRRQVSIDVTTQSLDELRASGAVRVTLENDLGRKLTIESSGAVVLTARRLMLDALELAASGSAKLDLAGQAAEVRVDLSGGSEVDARQLMAGRVELAASGSSTVKLSAKESVIGTASGSVGVKVHGHPRKALVKTSGWAEVEYVD